MSERVPTYTAEQVRAAERPLLEAGVPLMRRAAGALADVVRAELATPETVVTMTGVLEPVIRETPLALRPRVLVLAGSGDNGGDALYAAAHLSRIADVEDSRAWLIAVGPKGTAALEAWRIQLSEELGPLFADLTPDEITTLQRAALILTTRTNTNRKVA